MKNGKILIIGSGHLEYRIRKQIEQNGFETICFKRKNFDLNDVNESRFEYITKILQNIDFSSVSMAYIVDDNDDFNLEFIIVLISLYKTLPITASLFNENIAPHLRASHPNINIINPAKIAAPKFVNSLDVPIERKLNYTIEHKTETSIKSQNDYFISILIASFLLLISSSVVYFHFAENLSWINSLYFIVVTVATVGYGDINLLNSSNLSKIIDIIVILSSTLFIWLIFSLTVDRIIKKRTQLALGRKKYFYKNHVILCGLGRLGYFIAKELISRGEKIIIIEKDENSSHIDYFRSKNIDVYTGDARLPRVLKNVNIKNAKAVISVINNDYTNLEIGLNARSFDSNLRLILRIFDEAMSKNIRENLDIHLTLSMSAIADEDFVKLIKNA